MNKLSKQILIVGFALLMIFSVMADFKVFHECHERQTNSSRN